MVGGVGTGQAPDPDPFAEAVGHHKAGRLAAAAAGYRRAIAARPDFAEAYSNLGNALGASGPQRDVVAAFTRACHLAPRWPELHYNRGNALLTAEDFAAAEGAYAEAIRLRPDFPQARCNLAQALKEQGRTAEAAVTIDRTVCLAPGFAGAFVSRGILLGEAGQISAAVRAFDRALAIDPRSALAWFSRADLKHFSAGDADIDRMEAALATGGGQSGGRERILLHFALGKAWMDAGDADRAFAHLHQGNRQARAALTFDVEAERERLAAIAGSFTPAALERLAGAGDPSELPVFVVGMPRSGTTLVEQILAAHPQVHGAGELSTLVQLVTRFAGAGDFRGLSPTTSRQEVTTLGRDYVARLAPLAPEKQRIVDKMPANILHAGLIRLALPNARIIHCRRDPVDTCLSCYTKYFAGEQNFAYDLRELGLYYRAYAALAEHWRALLPADRFIEVGYEDVVDDLEGQARRLVTFCGLEWNDACLAFHQARRQVRTASLNQVRQPIYRSSVRRWERYAPHLGALLEALEIPPCR